MKIRLPVKLAFVFALQWDSADFFRTTKLLCFVQECRDTWGEIVWRQIEDEKYGTIEPKKRKAETENIDDEDMLPCVLRIELVEQGQLPVIWQTLRSF